MHIGERIDRWLERQGEAQKVAYTALRADLDSQYGGRGDEALLRLLEDQRLWKEPAVPAREKAEPPQGGAEPRNVLADSGTIDVGWYYFDPVPNERSVICDFNPNIKVGEVIREGKEAWRVFQVEVRDDGRYMVRSRKV